MQFSHKLFSFDSGAFHAFIFSTSLEKKKRNELWFVFVSADFRCSVYFCPESSFRYSTNVMVHNRNAVVLLCCFCTFFLFFSLLPSFLWLFLLLWCTLPALFLEVLYYPLCVYYQSLLVFIYECFTSHFNNYKMKYVCAAQNEEPHQMQWQ